MRYLYLTIIFLFSCSIQSDNRGKSKTEYRVETIEDLIRITEILIKDLKPKSTPLSFTYFQSNNNEKYSSDSVKSELIKISDNTYKYNKIIQNQVGVISYYDSKDVIKILEGMKQYESNGMVNYILSLEYKKNKNLGKSLLNIEEAINLNPFIESYYEQKAIILFSQKKYKESLTEYDKILKFTNQKWNYHYHKYLVLRISGNIEASIIELSSAIISLTKFKESNNSNDIEFYEKTRELGSYYSDRAELNFELGKIEQGCLDLRNAQLNNYEVNNALQIKCK